MKVGYKSDLLLTRITWSIGMAPNALLEVGWDMLNIVNKETTSTILGVWQHFAVYVLYTAARWNYAQVGTGLEAYTVNVLNGTLGPAARSVISYL